MKIVATVTDTCSVACAGGHAESRSAIINIPESMLPSLVLEYLAAKKREKESRSVPNGSIAWAYKDLSFSILQEDAPQNTKEAVEYIA